jgi:hypothetical protein
MGMSGQHHAPAALYPGERTPGTHWTGWTQRLEEKSSASVGDWTPVIQSIVRHYTDWATSAHLFMCSDKHYRNFKHISFLVPDRSYLREWAAFLGFSHTHLMACCSIWRWSVPVLVSSCSMVAFHWRLSALDSRIASAYVTSHTISMFHDLLCPLVQLFLRPRLLLLWNTLNIS